MKPVYVLYQEGAALACGPTLLALAEAIAPPFLLDWVEPRFWFERRLIAMELRTGVVVDGVRWSAELAWAPDRAVEA